MNYCANCAAPIPPSADFCPKCGKSLRVPVAPPTAPGAPVAPIPAATMTTTDPTKPVKRRAPWWIVPLVIVGLVVIAFLVLMGLPFGGRDADRPQSEPAKVETIAEGDPVPPRGTAQTATVVDVEDEPAPPVVVTQPPPVVTRQPPPVVTRQPPPAVTTQAPPVVTTQPPPVRTQPPPTTSAEIGVSEAMAIVRTFVTSRDYYGSGADCIGVSSLGYQNAGYTLEVRNTCSSRRLGRWRVDSKTRELFRQQEDGRYLRP